MITEETLPYEEMKRVKAQGYLCRECQGGIAVAWGGSFGVNGWILRCVKDINHTGITRHNLKTEHQQRREYSMDSTALTKMTETQMMERVNMARFPQDLTVQDKKLLAQAAISYGFDPLMGEISIYQGRPFVSIDGRYRKAQETEKLDGVETRPATKQEREDWQIPEGDYFFRSEVYLKGASRPFTGWGRVYLAETIGGKGFKPIEKNPQRMAEKRAEAQALRKAFHIPLPSFEDIGMPDYENVDTNTGEIKEPGQVIEGEVIEHSEEKSNEKSSAKKKEQKPKRDPDSLKSLQDMLKACHEDFNMQPADVWKELGYAGAPDCPDPPAVCYRTIAAVRQ